MKITGQTPQEAWLKLSKMREMFRLMRDERIMHPSVGLETREYIGDYYGEMMEAIDVGMAAIHKHHRLKIEPNLLTEQLESASR